MSFDITRFIDIHTHILYGVDDGSGSLEESIDIAKGYEKFGVKKVVATPHFLPGTAWSTPKEKIVELVESFQQTLDFEGIDLKIFAGMEIAFHNKIIERIAKGAVLPLGASEHYLIEPSFHGEQDSLLVCLSVLLRKGYKVILAHPERIKGLSDKIEIIEKLVQQGLLIQINSGSLLGHFGNRIKDSAINYWEKGCFHFIASDVHNSQKRRSLNSREWELLLEDKVFEEMLITCNKNLSNLF